jgi:predicted enzyme related to lactoylglutathione lyase
MERAISFYEKLLWQEVTSKDERMSTFELGNIQLLLYNPAVDNESVSYANNCIPTFEVTDIQHYKRLTGDNNLTVVMPLETIEQYKIFQFKDTEGNIIELYEEINL